MHGFATLFKNELKLNIRNMNMVIFAVIFPLVVLAALGFVYGTAPAYDGASFSFLEQSFGALCAISICAGGLMGLPLVVSDYRERKILKRFKVTPATPSIILVVELAIYVLYALASAVILFIAASLFWGVRFQGSVPLFLLSWLLTVASSLSIGVMVGGLAKNAKTASVWACVLYFPSLVFSGATLPFEVLPEPVQNVAAYLPLTQGMQAMKGAFLGTPFDLFGPQLVVLVAATAAFSFVAIRFFKWE
ncbi:ABC transporter permease [Xiamenia xianingshaonis]|uniref:Transport permease protein n=1 Tax=Xiamenia xianingshaonis TaxID=2682776 RepID=A0ABX0IML3_9ACTN|nr:ABC transporter permease [Xiamenia xianingshaonis]NHM14730.1 ABC transporter permease [Xiamenia xianingshaonis]